MLWLLFLIDLSINRKSDRVVPIGREERGAIMYNNLAKHKD